MESQLTLNNEIFNQAPDKEPYRQYYFMAALNKQLKKITKKQLDHLHIVFKPLVVK